MKTERHHWWPIAVSRHWGAPDGRVTRVSSKGETLALEPWKFGLIKNAHHIKVAAVPTVWDHSYERAFDQADSSFTPLIAWLARQAPERPPGPEPCAERLTPLRIAQSEHERMAECAASLIVRSPNMRSRIRKTTEYYRARMGLLEPSAPESLIGMNARSGQEMLGGMMKGGGKFAILHSPDRELIFGDGFLHNVRGFAHTPLGPQCLVPITPSVALFYIRPMSYRGYPRAFCTNLNAQEADLTNAFTQVYAGQYIFYRSEAPNFSTEFSTGTHRELRFHSHPWIEQLTEAVCSRYYGSDTQFRESDGSARAS